VPITRATPCSSSAKTAWRSKRGEIPRRLPELAEEPEDGLPPAVVTGWLKPPGCVPQDVLGEQVVESGGITLGGGGVRGLDASTFGCSAMVSLVVAGGRKPVSRSG